MSDPMISVVIPTWRECSVLGDCLLSLAAQDFPRERFEIILVAKEELDVDFNERTIFVKAESGINHAQMRNKGVEVAKGEIIAFCDDDCILPKSWLSNGVECMERNRAGLVGGPVLAPKHKSLSRRVGGYLSGSRFVVGFAASRHRNLFPEMEANEHNLILANTFVKRQLFEEIGGFDADQVPCEENLFCSRAKRSGAKLIYCPSVWCWHPAKPVVLGWARKIYFYATGRGMMLVRDPSTIRLQFIAPTIFFSVLILLLIFSFFDLRWAWVLISVVIVYFLLSLMNAFYIFWRFERNIAVLLLSVVSAFAIHFAYGTGVLRGVLRQVFGKRRIFMPSFGYEKVRKK